MPVGLIVAAVILFLQVAVYFLLGISDLVDAGVLGGGAVPALYVGGALTADGLLVIAGGVSLTFGTLGLAILAGLFLRQSGPGHPP